VPGEKEKENPFGDIDRVFNETLERQLALVKAIDEMDDDLNTWEAGFIQSVLDQLTINKRPLTQTQLDKLHEIADQYGIDRDEA
jgi:hypothetical protein